MSICNFYEHVNPQKKRNFVFTLQNYFPANQLKFGQKALHGAQVKMHSARIASVNT